MPPPDGVRPGERTGTVCGANVVRCHGCGHTIGPARQRRGLDCSKCPGAGGYPSTCRCRVSAPGLRCADHGGDTPQARRGAQRRRREATARAALARLASRETARRTALAPFAGDLRAAERAAALGDPDGVRQLRVVARQLRVASDELYRRCRPATTNEEGK